jgi:hypothetical protein
VEKWVFIGNPKEKIGYTFYTDPRGRSLLPIMDLSREAVSLEGSEWEEDRA